MCSTDHPLMYRHTMVEVGLLLQVVMPISDLQTSEPNGSSIEEWYSRGIQHGSQGVGTTTASASSPGPSSTTWPNPSSLYRKPQEIRVYLGRLAKSQFPIQGTTKNPSLLG